VLRRHETTRDSREMSDVGVSSAGLAALKVPGTRSRRRSSSIEAHSFRLTSKMWITSSTRLRSVHPSSVSGGGTTWDQGQIRDNSLSDGTHVVCEEGDAASAAFPRLPTSLVNIVHFRRYADCHEVMRLGLDQSFLQRCGLPIPRQTVGRGVCIISKGVQGGQELNERLRSEHQLSS